jgi:hypothetical protein
LNKKTFSFCLLTLFTFFALLISTNSHAVGSYLYCASDNGLRGNQYWNRKVNWDWSKGYNSNDAQTYIEDKYQNFTYMTSSGTWIKGYADKSAKTGQYFLLVKKTFENKRSAIRYCKSLVNKCIQEYGLSYKYVGASSGDIPYFSWGMIAVRYKQENMMKWTSCQNWMNSDYSELNYDPEWIVDSPTTFRAAGLIIYPAAWAYSWTIFGYPIGYQPNILSKYINLNQSVFSFGGLTGPYVGAEIGGRFGINIGTDYNYRIYQYTTNSID